MALDSQPKNGIVKILQKFKVCHLRQLSKAAMAFKPKCTDARIFLRANIDPLASALREAWEVRKRRGLEGSGKPEAWTGRGTQGPEQVGKRRGLDRSGNAGAWTGRETQGPGRVGKRRSATRWLLPSQHGLCQQRAFTGFLP